MGGIGSGRRPNPNKPPKVRKRLPIDYAALDAALRDAAARHVSVKSILPALSVSYQTALSRAERIGLVFKQGRHGISGDNAERLSPLVALYRDGYTLEQLGKLYGITRERVRQILAKYACVSGKDGGASISAVRRAEKLRTERNARCFKKFGCTYEQYLSLRHMARGHTGVGHGYSRTPTGAYRCQRSNARHRRIDWNLTLWQWWTIWKESGHWEERGRGQGYVMCRVNDEGPYAVGNVFIATAIENCSSAPKKKKSNLPCGVQKRVRGGYVTYIAQRCIGGKLKRLGSFKTPELARAAYLAAAQVHSEAA